jgi:hypothetical protein
MKNGYNSVINNILKTYGKLYMYEEEKFKNQKYKTEI